jgi:hypothetical protein
MKAILYTGALLAGLLFAMTLTYGTQPKPNYKLTRLSPNAIGFACLNGGDPTGQTVQGVLILSCGQ